LSQPPIMAKFSSLLVSIALVTIAHVVPSNAEPCPIVEVDTKVPLELKLGSGNSNCFQVGNSSSQDVVRLTIVNDQFYGRYAISNSGSGYAWSNGADGIYYCARNGESIVFDEFPEEVDPTVYIYAVNLPKGSTCSSEVIGYYGVLPVPTPTNGDTTEVFWSHHKYYLHAKHFEYQVKGEDVVTMKHAKWIAIGGDPGDSQYSTIEIEWEDENGVERRFNGYMGGTVSTWYMEELRIYNNEQDWAYFEVRPDSFKGIKESCFRADTYTVTNLEGDTIKFEEMTLATFMPWIDEEEFLKCINAFEIEISFPNQIDLPSARDAVADTLSVSPFQVQMMLPASSVVSSRRSLISGDGKTYRARVASANQVQAEGVYCAAAAENNISVLNSSVEADCPSSSGTFFSMSGVATAMSLLLVLAQYF